MKKAITAFSILLALAVLLCACAADPEPTEAPTSEPQTEPTVEEIQLPLNDTWDMTAVLVDDQGQVQKTMELKAKIKVWEQEGEVCYALYFHYPQDVYNSVSGTVPNADRGIPYNCCSGFGTETGAVGNRAASLYAALDYVKGCFIADFDDNQNVYLIAYKNPNTDLDSLWAYFQDFIQMRPETFVS